MEPRGGLRTEGIAEKSEVCDGWDELRNESLDRLKRTRTIEGGHSRPVFSFWLIGRQPWAF